MLLGHRVSPGVLILLGVLTLSSSWARGQGPTIDTPDLTSPGGGNSALGQAPGSGGQGSSNGPDGTLLGGRPGPTTPKGINSSISTPGQQRSGFGVTERQGIAETPNQAPATIPTAGGLLSVPPTQENPGPPDGLTLDQAIDRLIRENLDLRAKSVEIPQARADTLTASLRANPVFYADAQLVPYGQYTRTRPGGQTQYDVNISYPLDLSGKRRARTREAVQATKVIEAQYQDAVRQSIDNLYSGYVDVLQARRTIAFAEAGIEGLTKALRATQDLFERGQRKASDVARIRIQLRAGEQQLVESREALTKARRSLGALLNIPPDEADAIELYGTLKFPRIDLPPLKELIDIAVNTRPDVVSYKIGVLRAKASVETQLANRFQDVYVLAQPYTLQDNTPFGLKSPTSWALGITIPVPLYNRNQGNIERSRLNVNQTNVEFAAEQRQAIQDVQIAEREYVTARSSVDNYENNILPDATNLLNEAVRLFPSELPVLDYLLAIKDYNDNARSYLDALVRLRRAMLDLNTAVGRRILP